MTILIGNSFIFRALLSPKSEQPWHHYAQVSITILIVILVRLLNKLCGRKECEKVERVAKIVKGLPFKAFPGRRSSCGMILVPAFPLNFPGLYVRTVRGCLCADFVWHLQRHVTSRGST
eukprot:88284-Amphidinium_carterae.1